MAKFKSRKSEEKAKELVEAVSEPTTEEETTSVPSEEDDNKYMNAEEREVLEEQASDIAEEESKVSTEKMQRAIDLVSRKFNLLGGDFVVTGFVDKGTKVAVSLANADFDISITIKDSDRYGIF